MTPEEEKIYQQGQHDALIWCAARLRDTSEREIENKPGDMAFPIGAVGSWFRKIADFFEETASNAVKRRDEKVTWRPFEVGDMVTRDGTDQQKVLEVYDGGDMILVECTVASDDGWCEVGETESNLASRYNPLAQ